MSNTTNYRPSTSNAYVDSSGRGSASFTRLTAKQHSASAKNEPSDSSIEILGDVRKLEIKEKKMHPFFLEDYSVKKEYIIQEEGSKSAEGVSRRSGPLASVPVASSTVDRGKESPFFQRYQGGNASSTRAITVSTKRQYSTSSQSTKIETYITNGTSKTSTITQSSSKQAEEAEVLPFYSYMDYSPQPRVSLICSEEEANQHVQTLQSPLGFDLEWRPTWHAGMPENRTALVQMCDARKILLIRVSAMKRFPKDVMAIIESPNFVKTGVNIRNDGAKLFRDFGIKAQNLVELGSLASHADCEQFTELFNRPLVSLAKMTATYLHKTLKKGSVSRSNWEGALRGNMIEYAANDAHSALMIYNTLIQRAEQRRVKIDFSLFAANIDCGRPASGLNNNTKGPMRPQFLRAYNLWHHRKMPLEQMCMVLKSVDRVEPLKESTVITYVVSALQANRALQFDIIRLKELVKMEAGSWSRHGSWISEVERELSHGM